MRSPHGLFTEKRKGSRPVAASSERVALTVRITPAAMEILKALQVDYARKIPGLDALSQSDAIEVALHELAPLHKISINPVNGAKHRR